MHTLVKLDITIYRLSLLIDLENDDSLLESNGNPFYLQDLPFVHLGLFYIEC